MKGIHYGGRKNHPILSSAVHSNKGSSPRSAGWLFSQTDRGNRRIIPGYTEEARPAADGQIKETIEEELWDILYYVLAIANRYGIKMETVIPAKEEINNRKYQTGIRFSPT